MLKQFTDGADRVGGTVVYLKLVETSGFQSGGQASPKGLQVVNGKGKKKKQHSA